ncbi:MAG: polysaccharide deacetylase [Betaproteobacteria bacterium]|nr:polysaccharide deacetylase [Betaproteobacteria bacterium]MBI3936181.1 polysaccharide deacetylase [Betaproteobacteria bacterium]
MPRHIVCLTFDFDAMSGFIARGMTSPTPISRGEFGAVAASRILALLGKHDVLSSWFIPGHTLETYPDHCKQVFDAGHEIGHHGWTHVPPAMLTREKEEEGLSRANDAIRKLTGKHARGYRSPSWDLSPHSVDLLLKHGFVYDSSMMGDDYTPYRVRRGDVIELERPAVFGKPTRLVEMPVSWTLDDYPHFEFIRTQTWILQGLMNAGDVLENWVNDFLYLKRNLDWGIITYTFHPFVIGRGHRMLALEKLIRTLAENGAVFMTMEQAAAEYDGRAPFRE